MQAPVTPATPLMDLAQLGARDGASKSSGPRTLEWNDLIPPEFKPEELLGGADLATLDDADPRARELMDKLKKLWSEAPVVNALDGVLVRLPGFALPLDSDGKQTNRFLLVPYYGACIHVPPPPANQIVLVNASSGVKIRQAFDTVWVVGRMQVKRASTEFGDAGYTINASDVSPYKKN